MMTQVYNDNAPELGVDHWRVAHREQVFDDWLRQEGVTPDPSKSILELGRGCCRQCSSLRRYGGVTRFEAGTHVAKGCDAGNQRGLVYGDIETHGFGNERYDFVVDFDALHNGAVADPTDMVCRWYAALRAGGYLLLTEPAHRGGAQRDTSVTIRGWTRSELMRLLWSAGFAVRRVSGMLLPAVPVTAVAGFSDDPQPRGTPIGVTRRSPLAERLWRGLLWGERQALQHVSLPMGACWAVLAQRLQALPSSPR